MLPAPFKHIMLLWLTSWGHIGDSRQLSTWRYLWHLHEIMLLQSTSFEQWCSFQTCYGDCIVVFRLVWEYDVQYEHLPRITLLWLRRLIIRCVLWIFSFASNCCYLRHLIVRCFYEHPPYIYSWFPCILSIWFHLRAFFRDHVVDSASVDHKMHDMRKWRGHHYDTMDMLVKA